MHRIGVAARNDIRAQLLLCLFMTAVTVVAAQVSFHVWFTPVPVTLQVLAVILSGLVLGSKWGAITQVQYLALGAAGAPVFADWTGGPAAFVGPRGGYLIGFVAGAYVAGWAFERLRKSNLAAWVGGISGIAAIYLPGALWLAVWLTVTTSHPFTACVGSAVTMGIVPFIGVDILKAAAASALARKWHRQ
jgi:biotin transport system substrate-specific component